MNLVTGGAGFIGSHLVEALVAAGEPVRVLDDLSTGSEANLAAVRGRIELVRGSIVDLGAVVRASEGARTIYHLAACPSVPRSFDEPEHCHAVNATGTLHVAIAAARARAQRVVFASSCAIYGDGGEAPAGEERPPAPKSPYAAQKLLGEHYLAAYGAAAGFVAASLRFFNVFGPRQDPASPYSGVISIFCRELLRGAGVTIHGDGLQTRDFVAVEDVVQALLLAGSRPLRHGRIMNVATGVSRSLLELHDALAGLAGSSVPPRHGPAREGDVARSSADVRRIRAELGYAPRVSFEEGLARTLRWYRDRAPA